MPEFYVFIDKKRADELGIDINSFLDSWDVINSKLRPPDEYAIFSSNKIDTEIFKKYDNDPQFVKRIFYK